MICHARNRDRRSPDGAIQRADPRRAVVTRMMVLLDEEKFGKATVFDLKRHRRIEQYKRIASQTGVIYADGTKG